MKTLFVKLHVDRGNENWKFFNRKFLLLNLNLENLRFPINLRFLNKNKSIKTIWRNKLHLEYGDKKMIIFFSKYRRSKNWEFWAYSDHRIWSLEILENITKAQFLFIKY